MSDDNLSAVEAAYFDSKGNTEVVTETPAAVSPPPQPEQPAPEPAANVEQPITAPKDEFDDNGEPINKGQWVRHGALHAERERRKGFERQAAELREKFTRADERLALLNEALKQPEQATTAQTQPDPETDIFGYVKWQAEQIKALNERIEATGKRTEAQTADIQLRDAYRADAQRFTAEKPEFTEAYRYLMESRDKELASFGIADPQARAAQILEEEKALAQHALRSGRSPAAAVFEMAAIRGFQTKAADPAAPLQNAIAKTSAEIDRLARGAQASRSLSAAGGSAAQELSTEAVANMSEQEFNALIRRVSPEKMRALMGG